MRSDRETRLLEAIAGEARPAGSRLEAVCRACVSVLEVSSAAVILMSVEETGALVVASGREASEVEELQFTLGEGPCLVAFETGSAVLVPDLAGHRLDWPLFVHEAFGLGVHAVFALPLQVGAIRVGVLYLCQRHAGNLTREQLADAFMLAEIATWQVLAGQADAEPGQLGPELDPGWSHRAVVHQATGMVAAQLGVGLEDALSRLRSLAFGRERSIYDVARAVVARELKAEH